MKGWKKAGIAGVLNGTIVLPSEDHFSTGTVTNLILYNVNFCFTASGREQRTGHAKIS